MLVPFCLTLLWVLALAFRVLSNVWGRPWKNLWWTLILGGTFMLMPLMFFLDLSRWNARPHTIVNWLFVAASIFIPACCWIGVSTHVYSIHKKREQAARPRVVDYVIDICVYPVMLSLLASHAFLALSFRGDSLDAGTTLAASGVFESWALASVLALFESYASINLWMKVGAYQFLVINALVNVAAFFIKGVAPCKLCYRIGATSCVSLAKWFEHVKYSQICHHIHPSSCIIAGWLESMGTLMGIPEPELLPLAIGISGTIAVCIVASLEHDRGASLSKDSFELVKPVESQKTWLLSMSWTVRGSFLKLLGVKLIVGVIFLQPYLLGFLRHSIPGINVEIANAWMLTVEAFMLHLFHAHAAYPASDFAPGGALARPDLDFPGQNARYGSAPTDGEHDNGAENSSRLTWMEILIMMLLSFFVLSSWMSLSSMVNMGSCKASIQHGTMGNAGLFHTCDTAALTCNHGFELAWKPSNNEILAQCGRDEKWFLTESKISLPLSGCTSCAHGHIDYPNCVACSNTEHCKGHAHTVADDGKRQKCLCACDSKWTGIDCGLCAPGHISYPECLACSIDGHCNGHARSVTDDGNRTSCKCTCDSRYSGLDCSMCAPGHVSYPDCTPCSSAQHCNGHAASVVEDGSRNGCVCTCDTRYSGVDCSSCAPGHVDYPECRPCTNEQHCHGHAINVTDDGTRSQCICTCSEKFDGKHCGGFITQEHCTCKKEWKTCAFGFMACTTQHGCEKGTQWFGKSWCRTEDGCADSWDYC